MADPLSAFGRSMVLTSSPYKAELRGLQIQRIQVPEKSKQEERRGKPYQNEKRKELRRKELAAAVTTPHVTCAACGLQCPARNGLNAMHVTGGHVFLAQMPMQSKCHSSATCAAKCCSYECCLATEVTMSAVCY